MEVAIRDDCLKPGSLKGLAKSLNGLGIRSFELCINRDLSTIWGESLKNEKAQKSFAKKIEDLGITICAGLINTHLANEDAKPEVQYTLDASRILTVLGVKILRIDVVADEPDKEAKPWQEYLHRATSTVNICLEQTSDLPVEFAVENHGSISNKIEFLRSLYRGVGSPRLGHTLDTGNFYWYGYPISKVYEILEELAPRTKHAHFKNINYPQELRDTPRDVGWEYDKYVSPLADGDIDLGRVTDLLKKAWFKNDLCIEDESLGRFFPWKRKVVLKRDVEFLKAAIGHEPVV